MLRASKLTDESFTSKEEKSSLKMEQTAVLFAEKQMNILNSIQSLMKKLEEIGQNYEHKAQKMAEKCEKGNIDLEPRDRYVYIDVSQFRNCSGDGEQTYSMISEWFRNVCRNVFSTAFNFLFQDKMSFEVTKVYISECIIRNIFLLHKEFALGQDQLQLINTILKDEILTYLSKKYPLTLSNQVSIAMQKELKEIDIFYEPQNNYLYHIKDEFEFSKDGIYNGQIMRVINSVMELVDAPTTENNDSNFKEFKRYMEAIINDPTLKLKEAKFNLNKKVSSYIPFSQGEIQSNKLKIKSPAILRILTKWCTQLSQKFNQDYFLVHNEPFHAFKTKEKYRLDQITLYYIHNRCQNENKKITHFSNLMNIQNFQDQSAFLKHFSKQQQNCRTFDNMEISCSKFAVFCVEKLHKNIIKFLNYLIHNLLILAEQASINQGQDWTRPKILPCFLSLKIGDLIRCRYEGKEDHVVQLLKELRRRSEDISDANFKIIKLKDRMTRNTNDVQLMVRFNNKVTCEIQLVVENEQSKFIKCSNKLGHYIYQLQRTLMYPITEMCSIWIHLDERPMTVAKQIQYKYKKRLEKECSIVAQKEVKSIFWSKLKLEKMKCRLEQQNSCDQKQYSHKTNSMKQTNVIKITFFCQNVKQFGQINPQEEGCLHAPLDQRCLFHKLESFKRACTLNELYQTIKKAKLELLKSQIQYIILFKDTNQFMPKQGLCFLRDFKTFDIFIFFKMKYKGKTYILSRQGQKLIQIADITLKQKQAQFLNEYVIYQFYKLVEFTEKLNLPSDSNIFRRNQQQRLLKLLENLQDANQQLFLPEYLMECKKKQKERLCLNEYRLSKFPIQITSLVELTQLAMPYNLNGLKPITFPPEIKRLKNLVSLDLGNNHLSENSFPPEFNQLVNLQYLILNSNKFKKIPKCFLKFTKLKKLDFAVNQFSQVPDQIGFFKELLTLNFSRSIQSLTTISTHIKYLKKLENFQLSMNKIRQIPVQIQSLTNLKIFNMESYQS